MWHDCVNANMDTRLYIFLLFACVRVCVCVCISASFAIHMLTVHR